MTVFSLNQSILHEKINRIAHWKQFASDAIPETEFVPLDRLLVHLLLTSMLIFYTCFALWRAIVCCIHALNVWIHTFFLPARHYWLACSPCGLRRLGMVRERYRGREYYGENKDEGNVQAHAERLPLSGISNQWTMPPSYFR
jgi:hypothetical protein